VQQGQLQVAHVHAAAVDVLAGGVHLLLRVVAGLAHGVGERDDHGAGTAGRFVDCDEAALGNRAVQPLLADLDLGHQPAELEGREELAAVAVPQLELAEQVAEHVIGAGFQAVDQRGQHLREQRLLAWLVATDAVQVPRLTAGPGWAQVDRVGDADGGHLAEVAEDVPEVVPAGGLAHQLAQVAGPGGAADAGAAHRISPCHGVTWSRRASPRWTR